MKKTIAVIIGRREESKFQKVIRELRAMRFSYNGATKEWSKELEEEYVNSCLKQLKEIGLQAYIKNEVP